MIRTVNYRIGASRKRQRFSFGASLIELLIAILILAIGLVMIAGIWPMAIKDAKTSFEKSVGTEVAKNGLNMAKTGLLTFIRATNSGSLTINCLSPTDSDDPGYWTNPDPVFPYDSRFINWWGATVTGTSNPGGLTDNRPYVSIILSNTASSITSYSAKASVVGTCFRLLPNNKLNGVTPLADAGIATGVAQPVIIADDYHTLYLEPWLQEYPAQPRPSSNPYPYTPKNTLGFLAVGVYEGGDKNWIGHISAVSFNRSSLNRKVCLVPLGCRNTTSNIYFYCSNGSPNYAANRSLHGTVSITTSGAGQVVTTTRVDPATGKGYLRVGQYVISRNDYNCQYKRIVSVKSNNFVGVLDGTFTSVPSEPMLFVVHEEGSRPSERSVCLNAVYW